MFASAGNRCLYKVKIKSISCCHVVFSPFTSYVWSHTSWSISMSF